MRRNIEMYFIIVLLSIAAPQLRADERPIAIVHARIITGTGVVPIEDGSVIIEAGKIQSVGPSSSVTVPADSELIDASGKTLMPGLADLHVHLQGGWDGISMDLLGYQRYLNSLLYSGVTAVLDCGNVQSFILQLRQEVAQGHIQGPQIYCAGAMIDGADPAWPDLAYSISSQAQIPSIVERDKKAGVDIIKNYVNLSDRFIARLSEEASKVGLRVFVDQWSRNGSPDLVLDGIAGFAHLPTRFMSDSDIQVIQKHNVFVITTLTVAESFARTRLEDPSFLDQPLIADTTPPEFLEEVRSEAKRTLTDKEKADLERYRQEFLESKMNLKKLVDAGVLIAAGTDAPYPGVFQGEGIHHELELMVASGLTPLQAIRVATYDAARVMKAEALWGSVQPGRRADLILVSGNPAIQISDTKKIELVIQNGKILDRNKLKFDSSRDPGFKPIPGNFVE